MPIAGGAMPSLGTKAVASRTPPLVIERLGMLGVLPTSRPKRMRVTRAPLARSTNVGAPRGRVAIKQIVVHYEQTRGLVSSGRRGRWARPHRC